MELEITPENARSMNEQDWKNLEKVVEGIKASPWRLYTLVEYFELEGNFLDHADNEISFAFREQQAHDKESA